MFGALKRLQPRLGQWDGRRCSSRGEAAVLPHLLTRPVLLRLAIVLIAAIGVTLVAFWNGPPMPYRFGETYPHDITARVDFEILNHVGLANPDVTERNLIERYTRG